MRKLSKLNRTRRAEHFDSFDFSTLYTNIPHDLLSQNIEELISEAYRLRGATYLIVKEDGMAYWSNIASSKHHSIEEARLIEQIRFLVDNIYIQVGNRMFRQTTSVPLLISIRIQIYAE